jgi:hypothetical protein
MSDDDRVKSFLPDLRRFLKNFFGTDFEAYVAPFTPLAVNMDARGFFSFCFFGQDLHSLHLFSGEYRNPSKPPNLPFIKGGARGDFPGSRMAKGRGKLAKK